MDTLFPRAVAGYLATALFGLLAALHVVLPPSLTQPKLVAAIILVIAAVSAVVRVRRDGAPEADAKAWWQSKTIWTAIVSAVVAIAALFDAAPSLDTGSLVAAVLAIFGLVNAWLYPTASRPIAPIATGGTPPPALLLVGLVAATLILSLPGCASTATVRLDVDKAFVVSQLGFRSAQQTALAGIRSGLIYGDRRERVVDLVQRGQQAEDAALAARRLADFAAEAAAVARLSGVIAALNPAVAEAN